MTIAVDLGRKATNKQTNKTLLEITCHGSLSPPVPTAASVVVYTLFCCGSHLVRGLSVGPLFCGVVLGVRNLAEEEGGGCFT